MTILTDYVKCAKNTTELLTNQSNYRLSQKGEGDNIRYLFPKETKMMQMRKNNALYLVIPKTLFNFA